MGFIIIHDPRAEFQAELSYFPCVWMGKMGWPVHASQLGCPLTLNPAQSHRVALHCLEEPGHGLVISHWSANCIQHGQCRQIVVQISPWCEIKLTMKRHLKKKLMAKRQMFPGHTAHHAIPAQMRAAAAACTPKGMGTEKQMGRKHSPCDFIYAPHSLPPQINVGVQFLFCFSGCLVVY